jgi:hypothetical protein
VTNVGCSLASCGGMTLGVPPQISQADVDACKALLSARDATILQVLWDEHGQNIITDTVHDGNTCPILYWYPKWKAHQDGQMSDTEYAKAMLKFLRNKHKAKQPDNCKCVKRLKALGIVDWE